MSRTSKTLTDFNKLLLIIGIIMVACTIGMMQVDTSVLYHIVRGQSVIKLYVVYNMLDVSFPNLKIAPCSYQGRIYRKYDLYRHGIFIAVRRMVASQFGDCSFNLTID